MKKNAIIDIISNDLADIQLLINTFRSSETIPAVFIKMLEQKYSALAPEIDLLRMWQVEDVEKQDIVPTKPAENVEPVRAVKNVEVAAQQQKVEEKVESKVEEKPIEKPIEKQIEEPTEKVDPKVEPQVEQKFEPKPEQKVVAEVVKPVEKPIVKPVEKPKPHAASAADIKAFGTPVSSVAKAFSINDRILYQKELFASDNQRFTNELAVVDKMQSFAEAKNYFCVSHPDWDEQNDIVAEFFRTIHRRFI